MVEDKKNKLLERPKKIGLYDPSSEKDSCGVGLVANIKGIPSREIMDDAYLINSRMDHRGGCGFEENTGDGAGILMALPDSFFQDQAKKIKINLPSFGNYATGNIFLPQDKKERSYCKKVVEETIKSEGQEFLGWRKVPVNPKKANVGPAALDCQPEIQQIFIQKSSRIDQDAFERKLYLIRKIFTKRLRYRENLKQSFMFYACTLSSRLIATKVC